MTTLVWGIKASLLDYIDGMADGVVAVSGGAERTSVGFEFPGDASMVFRGSVTLEGHSGMLHLVFADPALAPQGDEWVLSIADPDDPGIRLPFARIAALVDEPDGRRGAATALTAAGADLFFGPYTEGTAIDDPFVRS